MVPVFCCYTLRLCALFYYTPSPNPHHLSPITQHPSPTTLYTMSEMRYAYTKILIVTCYLLLQGCYAMPSFCLRFRFAPIDGASTDQERIRSEGETDLERRNNGTASKGKPEHFSRLFVVFQAYRKPEFYACCYVIETVSRLYVSSVLCVIASLSLSYTIMTCKRNHDR